ITFIRNIYKNKFPYISKSYFVELINHKIFVPIVLDNVELLVHYYRHQQDAGSQTEQIGMLFNFDGALTKRKQIPNEMGLAVM
ncbi:hypothetical protein OFN49_32815, partial [Escherichia coli]|nr:hypothetical protein [Escherichia coli]